MDYTKGYTAKFYVAIVDPDTWMDTTMMKVEAGSIKRDKTGLRHSAEITVPDFTENEEKYIRVYMDILQNGELEHIPLFTGLATSPTRKIDGAIKRHPLEVFSVLKPLDDIKLPRGYYITAGMSAGAAVRRLLQGTPAPFEIEADSPIIMDYIVAQDNESNVSMIDTVLDTAGWQLTIDGSGAIHVGPQKETPSVTFSPANDVIEKVINVKRDWYKCPNVLRATSGDMYAVARDDDPDSMLSTVKRGREVVAVETNVTLGSNEGIGEYADRRLKELQDAAEEAEYTRVFVPELNVGDVVSANYEQIQGRYTVKSQTIQLTHGAQTTETIERSLVFTAEETVEPTKHVAALVLPDGNYLIMPDGRRLTVPVKTISTN